MKLPTLFGVYTSADYRELADRVNKHLISGIFIARPSMEEDGCNEFRLQEIDNHVFRFYPIKYPHRILCVSHSLDKIFIGFVPDDEKL